MSDLEVDNSMETFMTLFNKMFSETKYNLQALNKRMEGMDKFFSNVILLTSDKPFDEVNEEEEDEKDENFNSDNLNKKSKSANKIKGKMTSEEIDEMEKMFIDIDKPSFINKKRNEEKNLVTDPKSYYADIQKLLKSYSLDKDKDEKKKGKRGRKKKKIEKDSESNAEVDYVVPEKSDGFSKFKEFKELKNKMNKKGNKYSDEEGSDDIYDM